MEQRENKVALARLNGQAKRYETMKNIIVGVVKSADQPTAEETRLLGIAYSKLEHALRDAWRFVSAKLEEPDANSAVIEDCRETIRQELNDLCSEVIALMDNDIIPRCTSGALQVFCFKMKGDYNRYIAECTLGDDKRALIERAEEAYKTGFRIATKTLEPSDSARLGLVLNYSVFAYEFKGRDEGKDIAVQALNDAEAEGAALEKNNEGAAILKLLQGNLDAWGADEK